MKSFRQCLLELTVECGFEGGKIIRHCGSSTETHIAKI